MVRYSKGRSFLNVIVTGMFFLFGSFCLFFGLRFVFLNPVTVMTSFGIAVLFLFWVTVGIFLVINLKHVMGTPAVRFIANREGLFLDITTNPKHAFFIPWQDVDRFQVREISDPFWAAGGVKSSSDTLSISFKQSNDNRLPRVVKNVALATQNEINLNSYTLDISLEEAVSKLSGMKKELG